MNVAKRLLEWRACRKAAGVMAAQYLRLVWKTNRVVFEPPDLYERALSEAPIIIGIWHGQHFLMPFLRRDHPTAVLISRHRDGELNAIAAEHLGARVIRGSGAHGGEFQRKGGVPAFQEMLEELKQGHNVVLTADVPKVSRVAGRGIVNLAAMSGRPIFVVAIATSNRKTLNNWDRSALNLPFGRGAVLGAGPIHVAADAADAALEASRRTVEAELNALTARAYDIVDRRHST